MAVISGSIVRADLIDNFEDGDATQNPAWQQLTAVGPYSVVADPLRSGNQVLQAHGANSGHLFLTTPASIDWQGFSLSFEYMTGDNNYGPWFMVGDETYTLGTRFTRGTSNPTFNGRWYIADNAELSPEWLTRDPNAPNYILPASEWLRIQIVHDPNDGLIHGSIIRISDGALLQERTYSPITSVPLSSITSVTIGIEETPWQYVDNIYLTPEPSTALLLGMASLFPLRRRRT